MDKGEKEMNPDEEIFQESLDEIARQLKRIADVLEKVEAAKRGI